MVNPDSIRKAIHGKPADPKFENLVWFHARIMVESLFYSGHSDVILDATNVSPSTRLQWQSEDWRCAFVGFNVPAHYCIARALQMGQDYLVPVIDRMAQNLVWPGPSEGDLYMGPKFQIRG